MALVTGGARRIGRALCLRLAEGGADIGFTFRQAEREALELEQTLRARGVRAAAVRADLRHPEAAAAAVAAVHAALGRIDVLINNAGRYEAAAFERISDGQWEEMLATNLSAPFFVARAAVPLLRASGDGRMIQLTSIGALRAFPTHAHYCASKAGLAHLTRAMARALAPEIAVNAIAPGLIALGEELTPWEEHMRQRTPLQRAGAPGDVADAAVYLATCNRFLTGQTLVVDGGLSLL